MHSESFHRALLYELLKEQASTLGRAGLKLENLLREYRALRAAPVASATQTTEALLDRIAEAVWELALLRELAGFTHDNMHWIQVVFELPPEVLGRLALPR